MSRRLPTPNDLRRRFSRSQVWNRRREIKIKGWKEEEDEGEEEEYKNISFLILSYSRLDQMRVTGVSFQGKKAV